MTATTSDNLDAKRREIGRLSERFMPAMSKYDWTPNEVVDAIVMELYTSPLNDYPNHETDAELYDLTTELLGNEQRWERDQ